MPVQTTLDQRVVPQRRGDILQFCFALSRIGFRSGIGTAPRMFSTVVLGFVPPNLLFDSSFLSRSGLLRAFSSFSFEASLPIRFFLSTFQPFSVTLFFLLTFQVIVRRTARVKFGSFPPYLFRFPEGALFLFGAFSSRYLKSKPSSRFRSFKVLEFAYTFKRRLFSTLDRSKNCSEI